MNLQLLPWLTGLIIARLYHYVDGRTCYVCHSGDTRDTEVSDMFPDRPPRPCSQFDASQSFQYQCPGPKFACLTRVNGNNVTRSCTSRLLEDCKAFNGVLYCFCNSDFCNRDVPTVEESDQEPKGEMSFLGKQDTVQETPPPEPSDSFSLLNEKNQDVLDRIGVDKRGQQQPNPDYDGEDVDEDTDEGDDVDEVEGGSGLVPHWRQPPHHTTTPRMTKDNPETTTTSTTTKPNLETKDAGSHLQHSMYLLLASLIIPFVHR